MNKNQRFLAMILLLLIVPFITWVIALAKLHDMPVVTIDDLSDYLQSQARKAS